MPSMTVAYANDLTRDLATVLERLEGIASLVTVMETKWSEKGDGTVDTLYTDEHRQQFAGLVSWTQTLLSAVNARQVATAEGVIVAADAEALAAVRSALFASGDPEPIPYVEPDDSGAAE